MPRKRYLFFIYNDMKSFEQYKDMEQLFLELAHIDELEIRFNFISNHNNSILFFYKDIWLFDQDKKTKEFYINYDNIWLIIKSKFNLKIKEIRYFFTYMIEKYFNLTGYEPFEYTIKDYNNMW